MLTFIYLHCQAPPSTFCRWRYRNFVDWLIDWTLEMVCYKGHSDHSVWFRHQDNVILRRISGWLACYGGQRQAKVRGFQKLWSVRNSTYRSADMSHFHCRYAQESTTTCWCSVTDRLLLLWVRRVSDTNNYASYELVDKALICFIY